MTDFCKCLGLKVVGADTLLTSLNENSYSELCIIVGRRSNYFFNRRHYTDVAYPFDIQNSDSGKFVILNILLKAVYNFSFFYEAIQSSNENSIIMRP